MNTSIDEVNAALSRALGRRVRAGYNNGGWPVIWLADSLEVIAGGLPGQAPEIPSAVLSIIEKWGALHQALEEFNWESAELDELKRAAEEAESLQD